jgi:hypothetical protein
MYQTFEPLQFHINTVLYGATTADFPFSLDSLGVSGPSRGVQAIPEV